MESLTVVATGEKWVGYGVRSFGQIIAELINGAERQILITIYAVTDPNLYAKVESALRRGVEIHVYSDNTDIDRTGRLQSKLDDLQKQYPNLKIHTIDEEVLHAKVIVTDNTKVLVGSANLSHSGLVNNYELGLLVNDRKVADRFIGLLRALE